MSLPRGERAVDPPRRHTLGWALAAALACAAGFVLVYLVSDRTLVGQRIDDRVFLVLYSLVPGGWAVDGVVFLARDVVIVVLAAATGLLAIVALYRRQVRLVLQAAAVTALTVPTTPWLRDEVLTRLAIVAEAFPLNSTPSTHASAAAALTAAVVILWPARRPWWLRNAALVVLVLVALGNIVGQAHRPSDVLGSYLLVTGVVAATVAVFGWSSAVAVRDR